MTADEAIQKLGTSIYTEPLSEERLEALFPSLDNPLHLVILLIDCDTEICMNGILGFLENDTGAYLAQTIAALRHIASYKVAADLQKAQECMQRHGVTWEQLRADFSDAEEFEVTTFQKTHGESLAAFAHDLCDIMRNFSVFNHTSLEPTYQLLCTYLERHFDLFKTEILARDSEWFSS